MDRTDSDDSLKVAFIHQPWSVIQPPMDQADSVALLTDKVARRLAQRGCRVICYCRRHRGQLPVERSGGVEYRRAPVSIDRWVKLGMQALDRRGMRNSAKPFFSSPLCYRQFIHHVIEDLQHRNCDVVHIHNFSQFVPLIRAALPDIRIVLQMHCEWLTQLDASMVEHRLAHADLVLGVSNFLARKVRQRFPGLADRCEYVYNGADVEMLSKRCSGPAPLSGPVRILFVGRLSPEKGVHTLLDAFAAVLRKYPRAELHLIGPEAVVPREMILPFCDDPLVLELEAYYRPGAYAQALRERISGLPEGSVALINQGMRHSELARQYQQATVFVAPSVWEEPFGMPLVEAMASGTAVVATHGGAYPEIVSHGETGLLVERGDPGSLADAILRLLDDPSYRTDLARAGQERAAARFSWDCTARSLLNSYQRVLDHQPATEEQGLLA
jgi:glycosyltransferase involved in cell wall biosynthesis